jgi:cell fate (sporulation/competence/biofilm development) regulator YlbF (YheA/YmcA/DUF963 family)
MVEVDRTIELIDKSDIVKRLRELKSIMDSDEEIKKLSLNFNVAKNKYNEDNIVTEELYSAKKEFYNNPVVSEYRKLYVELNNSFLKFSKDINTLLKEDKGACRNN